MIHITMLIARAYGRQSAQAAKFREAGVLVCAGRAIGGSVSTLALSRVPGAVASLRAQGPCTPRHLCCSAQPLFVIGCIARSAGCGSCRDCRVPGVAAPRVDGQQTRPARKRTQLPRASSSAGRTVVHEMPRLTK
jgi:hypothetical protein